MHAPQSCCCAVSTAYTLSPVWQREPTTGSPVILRCAVMHPVTGHYIGQLPTMEPQSLAGIELRAGNGHAIAHDAACKLRAAYPCPASRSGAQGGDTPTMGSPPRASTDFRCQTAGKCRGSRSVRRSIRFSGRPIQSIRVKQRIAHGCHRSAADSRSPALMGTASTVVSVTGLSRGPWAR
jgi:hypothetical protein